jgi:hypothetical protein
VVIYCSKSNPFFNLYLEFAHEKQTPCIYSFGSHRTSWMHPTWLFCLLFSWGWFETLGALEEFIPSMKSDLWNYHRSNGV